MSDVVDNATPAETPTGAPGETPTPAPGPAPAAAPAARERPAKPWRWFPETRRARVAAAVALGLLVGYTLATGGARIASMFLPWSADGDQAQAVWQYWRYHISGVFPPGDLLVDYAFVMHAPPVWWAMMAGLSEVFEPVTSAKILNVVAYLVTPLALLLGVWRRSNVFVGVAAAFLMVRNEDFSGMMAGGYARSFGPLLTLMFIGLFLAGRHRAVLGLLVLQAALYPSVVMPCGIAYGAYVVVKGPMRARLRRCAGMFVAGLLVLGFGEIQNLRAPAWWGSLVTEAEAMKMPSWGRGGRIHEAPLRPWPAELDKNLMRPFRKSGSALPVHPGVKTVLALTVLLVAAAGAAVVTRRRRRRDRGGGGDDDDDDDDARFPWQLLLLGAAALAAYFFARAFAFKFYLPYRPLQHVLAYLYYTGIPLFLWCAFTNLGPRRRTRATVATVALTVVPMFACFGLGNTAQPQTYGSYARFVPLYRFVRDLPKDALLAGDFEHMSSLPLFAHHRVYVNRNLAHPFRKGYFAEIERRIDLMYRALYATRLEDVVAFARKEHVDYLVYRTNGLLAPDRSLFMPVRRTLEAVRRKAGKKLVMVDPPQEAVVYRRSNEVVVDVDRLEAYLAAHSPHMSLVPGAVP